MFSSSIKQVIEICLLIVVLASIAACTPPATQPVATDLPLPTDTPSISPTRLPSATITLTPTRRTAPTKTLIPTITPRPTASPTITIIPILSQTRLPSDSCPMGDAEFCDFVRTLQPLILNSDIEGMLRYAHYGICKSFEGWVDCGGETYCFHLGMLQGDGACQPVTSVKYFWDGYAIPPLVIMGVVYPILPDLGLETNEELSGPVILVKTFGDDEHDLLIFCKEYDDQWRISAILLQNEAAAILQTPPQVIFPWP